MRLTHLRLLVDDFRACFRFSRDVLRQEVTWEEEDEGYADFRAGDAIVALMQRGAQGEVVDLRPSGGDGAMVVLAVGSVDEEAERLREHLLSQPQSRADWGMRFAHLRDPAATLIEINEPIPLDDA